MRYLFGFLSVCALGAIPLVGCGESDGAGACDSTVLAGEWTVSSVSCDGVAHSVPSLDYILAANCTGETVITVSATCEITTEFTFTFEAEAVDPGAITCSAGCAADECQATADGGQPYTSTGFVSSNTWTSTTWVTEQLISDAQLISDELIPCQAGEIFVVEAVRK